MGGGFVFLRNSFDTEPKHSSSGIGATKNDVTANVIIAPPQNETDKTGTEIPSETTPAEKTKTTPGDKNTESAGGQHTTTPGDISAVTSKDKRTIESNTSPSVNNIHGAQKRYGSLSGTPPTNRRNKKVEEITAQEETSLPENSTDLLQVLRRNTQAFEIPRSELKIPAVNKHPNSVALNIPCPEKNAAGNKKYLEVYAGPDYAFRSFSDTANSTYLQKRKETTSFKSAYSVGFRYTRVFDNGMSLRTGINFSQINEKFQIVEGNVVQTVYITDINGDTIGNYSTVGTRFKVTHNRYRTLDIPLSVGYELGNGRLHTNLNAGVMVNVYSWQRGEVVDTASKAVVITTGNSSSPYQFKTNIGVGFLGAVSVYYKLNDRLHLLAEPYFRYNLSSVNRSAITLKQKYHTAGIRFGLRVDLK